MKTSSIFSVPSCTFAVALIITGIDTIHAQIAPQAGGTTIGQPPSQSPNPVIGEPMPGRPGSGLGQPGSLRQGDVNQVRPYGGTNSTGGRDVTMDALDRANRDAADINLDSRIDPGEAARMPGISSRPRPGVPSTGIPINR
jgi:hypothetical protein